MWLHLNTFLFGDQKRKWIVLLATVAVSGVLAASVSVSDRLALPVITVLLVAGFPAMLVLYDRVIAMLARGGSRPQSALDVLAQEHSRLRVALHDLAASDTAIARREALDNFNDEFDRHGLSEEVTFFNALTKAHPRRLAPQILTFTGSHRPITLTVYEMMASVDEASFAERVATLTALVEDHIKQEERFFPEILRVAGHDFLVRVRNDMSHPLGYNREGA